MSKPPEAREWTLPVRRAIDRIFSGERMRYDSGCWMWQGWQHKGYGRLRVAGRDRQVHRVVYEALIGPLPQELTLDHLCRNGLCCNPTHMEPVPSGENARRGVSFLGSRTTCGRGHPYSKETLAIYPDGYRRCRKCRALKERAIYRAEA